MADGTGRNPERSDGRRYRVIRNRWQPDRLRLAAGTSTLTFTVERHPNGDLDLKPVLPTDPGDRLNWASAPWKRIGPPIRELP